MNLQRLTDIFCKHLKMSNVKLMMLHANLAVLLSRGMEGTPLWLINVGSSGDGKSEILIALDDKTNTYMLHEITSRTLVSGFSKKRKVNGVWEKINFDLAPQLDGKVVLIPDMAQILKLHPNEKAQVWAQLRELYDGRAGKKSGNMEEKKSYEGLRISLLANSTPAIDSQILIHQDLGTRELLFRTDLDKKEEKLGENEKSLSDKVWENEEHESSMRIELNSSVKTFMQNKKIRKIDIPKEIKSELENSVEVLRHLRASAEIDSFSGELIGVVYPEQPTRALKQLKRLFIALKSLDDNYPDDLAIQIIRHIVKSSCSYNRWLVLSSLLRISKDKIKDKISVNDIAQDIKLGIKTIYRELNILWNLGLIEREIVHKDYYGKSIDAQYWKPKESNDLIRKIERIFDNSPDSPYSNNRYIFSIRTFFILKKEKSNNNSDIPYCQVVNHDSPDNNNSNNTQQHKDLTEEERKIVEDFS